MSDSREYGNEENKEEKKQELEAKSQENEQIREMGQVVLNENPLQGGASDHYR